MGENVFRSLTKVVLLKFSAGWTSAAIGEKKVILKPSLCDLDVFQSRNESDRNRSTSPFLKLFYPGEMYPSPACLIRSAWCSDPWHLPLVFAGHRSALWHGHRRVEPSQSTPGRVRCPPARSQPPLQGRAAEGVERAGPSSPRHLSSAEGPTHINPPRKLPDLVTREFLIEVQPCIFITRKHSFRSLALISVSVHSWEN